MQKNQQLAVHLTMDVLLDLWKLSDKDRGGQMKAVTWRLFNEYLKAPGKKNEAFWNAFVTLSEVVAHSGFLAKVVVDYVLESDAPSNLRKRMNQLLNISRDASRATNAGSTGGDNGDIEGETGGDGQGEQPETPAKEASNAA